jgi:hypothetical protein
MSCKVKIISVLTEKHLAELTGTDLLLQLLPDYWEVTPSSGNDRSGRFKGP